MVFGSLFSASTWEPLRRGIEALARENFDRKELLQKHATLLEQVTFDSPPPPGTKFAKACPCSKQKGVMMEDGTPLPSPHHIYVDDDLIAAIPRSMPMTFVSGAEAIFQV